MASRSRNGGGRDDPRVHRIILFPPGVNASKQGTDASESVPLKQQRDSSSGRFVWAGTIDDDIPVAWKLVVANFDFVKDEVDRSSNDRRVALQLGAGS